jgi:hypothetical protein
MNFSAIPVTAEKFSAGGAISPSAPKDYALPVTGLRPSWAGVAAGSIREAWVPGHSAAEAAEAAEWPRREVGVGAVAGSRHPMRVVVVRRRLHRAAAADRRMPQEGAAAEASG